MKTSLTIRKSIFPPDLHPTLHTVRVANETESDETGDEKLHLAGPEML